MGDWNEYLVLDHIRQAGPTTRPQVAGALGLSAASVSRIATRLLARGLLAETFGEARTAGRPARVLTFNALAGTVVGIDLGGTRCRGVLADLLGEPLAEHQITVAEAGGGFAALTAVWQRMAGLAAERELAPQALAVGVPAVIDPRTSLATRGPNVGWEGFDIVGKLGELVDVEFAVENDVNLAARGEASRGAAKGVANFAVLSVGTGLGSAIVSDGQLVRGGHNAAGEIGTLVTGFEQLGERRVGRIGGMESVVCGPAIAFEAARLAAGSTEARAELGERPSASDVFAAAAAGGRHATGIVGHVLDGIALCVLALGAVADPELVLLGGSVGRAVEPFLGALTERVERHSPAPPRIVVTGLGSSATALGAVDAAVALTRDAVAAPLLAQLGQGAQRS
ncbi:ROK family transcriptional regulator [Pseudonocardia sp. TRM90224]|uniref:ROK family transcriptional regulator n=1 Tax=Pseudonocardia sp. TRM90224 TaxID=2812678 RepID=UPI001E372EB8|nr:ROK family transcriptional regulator [Pseudonocardia sp. TRM90224]